MQPEEAGVTSKTRATELLGAAHIPTLIEIKEQMQFIDGQFESLRQTALKVKADRDALLEALKQILGSVAWSPSFDRALDKGRKAVAQAEGNRA